MLHPEQEEKLIINERQLATAILIRAIADAIKADSLAEDSEEAWEWLHSDEADFLTDGAAMKAVRAIEADPEGFKVRFKQALRQYK